MQETNQVIRERICFVGKLLYDKGLIAGTQGNISCLMPGGEILITPAGLCKGLLKPEEIVVMTSNGALETDARKPSSEYRLHLYGYSRRPDFAAAVHAHPPYVTAFGVGWANLKTEKIPEIHRTFGRIPYLPFEEPGTQALADRLGEHISECHTFFLESHGIIAFGANLLEAFFRVEMAEQLAKTLCISHSMADASVRRRNRASRGSERGFSKTLPRSLSRQTTAGASGQRRRTR